MPGHYETESAEKTIDEPTKLLDLKSLDLNVQEDRKRGHTERIGDILYKFSGFDTHKEEMLEEIKKLNTMTLKIWCIDFN